VSESRSERYRFECLISNKGGFGDVWLATDTLLDRQVAVKCPKVTQDVIRRERFLAEARMLARLNHPNITQIYDAVFAESGDSLYLVMEYVAGKDLGAILEGSPIPLDIIPMVAKGILGALAYAHERGIVHRDIKPSNVIIGEEVKLTDFGLADLKSILWRGTDRLAGTPAYIAPEQVEGRPVDGRADLYSLGVVLYEMITGGCLPFDCTNEVEMLAAHLRTAPISLTRFVPTVPPALEAVVMRLLAKDPEDRYPSAEAVVKALGAVQVGPKLGNLPVWLTPFVGREGEMAAIGERLEDPDCRLLTLVGPGGIGKTRLAVEAARVHGESFVDGVFFVSLAPLHSADAIVPTVAQSLGFSFYAASGVGAGAGGDDVEPRQQLLEYLRHKSMLLVMDNFEHLLGGAGLVTDLLKTALGVKIAVTSRTRLNMQGEHLFPVGGMDYPEETALHEGEPIVSSAVRLFLHSAQRVRPGFEPTADDLAQIGRICRLVEGMPLATELAAGLVLVLDLAEIAIEIEQSLDILETDLRDVPKRQQSVRATLDQSWRLLTERQQEVLAGLSVFRGDFAREAARQVIGASLRELMALVNMSLLQRTSTGRFTIHELLRQYTVEQLEASGMADAVRGRHSEYYMNALYRHRLDLTGCRGLTAGQVVSGEQADAACSPISAASQPLLDPLTKRELEVLQLITAGLSNQEIAQRLYVAVSTVKKHINRIYGKLGVKRRTQAVARARELYLL
jgi:predicted ATPase/DNA-binding CsgD family transcriptional regulator